MHQPYSHSWVPAECCYVLTAVQHNLGAAVAAIGAARQVLVQCLQAGQLIQQHKLYQALCLLDKIRQQHLGECTQHSMQWSFRALCTC